MAQVILNIGDISFSTGKMQNSGGGDWWPYIIPCIQDITLQDVGVTKTIKKRICLSDCLQNPIRHVAGRILNMLIKTAWNWRRTKTRLKKKKLGPNNGK